MTQQVPSVPQPPRQPPPSHGPVGAGRPLGSRYLLQQRIGRGAMGTVWRAVTRDDGRVVAVKVLREELATETDIVTRFVQERNVLLRLDHPRLVRLRDLVAEGDVLALVMDFVSGGDLGRWMREHGPLSPTRALRTVAAVADGLAAVHEAGVVHRDLKPANLLVEAGSDGHGAAVRRVRISDFGIARIVGGPRLTATATVVGTPDYVAPEVVQGREPTAAADIYAAGVVLYELLSGRPPFHADHPLTVLRRQVDEQPRRPDGMAEPLWQEISRCLAKDPAQRPDAAVLRSRLEALATAYDGDEPSAPPPRRGPHVAPPRRTPPDPPDRVRLPGPPRSPGRPVAAKPGSSFPPTPSVPPGASAPSGPSFPSGAPKPPSSDSAHRRAHYADPRLSQDVAWQYGNAVSSDDGPTDGLHTTRPDPTGAEVVDGVNDDRCSRRPRAGAPGGDVLAGSAGASVEAAGTAPTGAHLAGVQPPFARPPHCVDDAGAADGAFGATSSGAADDRAGGGHSGNRAAEPQPSDGGRPRGLRLRRRWRPLSALLLAAAVAVVVAAAQGTGQDGDVPVAGAVAGADGLPTAVEPAPPVSDVTPETTLAARSGALGVGAVLGAVSTQPPARTGTVPVLPQRLPPLPVVVVIAPDGARCGPTSSGTPSVQVCVLPGTHGITAYALVAGTPGGHATVTLTLVHADPASAPPTTSAPPPATTTPTSTATTSPQPSGSPAPAPPAPAPHAERLAGPTAIASATCTGLVFGPAGQPVECGPARFTPAHGHRYVIYAAVRTDGGPEQDAAGPPVSW